MKKILITSVLSTIIASGFGQSFTTIHQNNIEAFVQNNMLLFNNSPVNNAGFEVPAGNGTHTIYASNLWIGSTDANGQTRVSQGMFGTNHDFSFGPVQTDPYNMSPSWDRLWRLQSCSVDSFIAWYEAGVYDAQSGTTTQAANFPGYQVPQEILDWPCHGDVSLGQSHNLANFFDRDNDGMYNPVSAGDYPLIKGDETVLFIANDQLNPGGLGIEVITMVYAWDCTSSEALRNTVFVNYDIRNRSGQGFQYVYAGQWTDLDIGGAADDLVGCDVTRGMYYGYNGDFDDEPAFGHPGFGSQLPAQGVLFLAGPPAVSDNLDNPSLPVTEANINAYGYGDGIVDNERLGMGQFGPVYWTGGSGASPSTPADFYKYLTGTWHDGSPMYYGGTGHFSDPNADTLTPTRYMFPHDSDPMGITTNGVPQQPWSAVSAGRPPSDMRAIGSYGPFSIADRATFELDFAFTFAQPDSVAGLLDVVEELGLLADSVKYYFNTGHPGCCTNMAISVEENQNPFLATAVYPNPANNILFLNNIPPNTSYKMYNIVGELVMEQNNIASHQINTEKLASGTYILVLQTPEYQQSFKLIVDH